MKKILNHPFFNRFDPKDKPKKQQYQLLAITVLALVLGGFCLGLLGLYFATGSHGLSLFWFYLKNIWLITLNTLPYLILAVIVWLATNRAWIGFLSGSVLCICYSFAEYWKLIARDDAIYAEDLGLLKEAAKMTGSYTQITWQMVVALILVALGTLVFYLFFRAKLTRFSVRISLIAAAVVSCVLLYNGPYTSQKTYNSFKVWDNLNPWFQNSNYISRGGIYPFINSIQTAFTKPPKDYNKAEAEQVLKQYSSTDLANDQKVSVITVQLEAFSDLSTHTDLLNGDDAYSAFHKLQSESYSGKLVTNVFAGGTIDTERCVLTGFFELGSFRRESFSYARWFKDQGYDIQGAHAGYQAFYNRINVNRNLGIDNYRFIENYYNTFVNGIPTDEVLLPDIANTALEQIKNGNSVFSFNVTYQNHGPYATDKYDGEKEYIKRGTVSDYDYNVVNNYLSGVKDTGNRLLEMADMFRNIDQPVILVLYGDHKPWLGESSSTYQSLGIDLFSQSDNSFHNHYGTEYLIWANDAAKSALGRDFTGTGPTISPCFLYNVLFEQCGWQGPSYLKFTNEVMATLPVITTNDRFMSNNTFVPYSQLSKSEQSMLTKMRHVQYYLMRDSEGKLP